MIFKKIVLLLLPVYLFAVVSPYESLDFDEKINLMANYFFNEELQSKLPKKPEKQKHEKIGDIKAIKHEAYFAYIQRLKALKKAWEEEEKKINEKYEGEVGYYNGNMKALFKFYKKPINQKDIIQNSINKTLKVFLGKPKLQNLEIIKDTPKIEADLFANDFYGYGYKFEHRVVLDIPLEDQMSFYNRYRRSKIIVRVHYEDRLLSFADVKVYFEGKEYNGRFKNNVKDTVKLDIKINDDIFQPIKIKEE